MLTASLQAGIKTDSGGNAIELSSSSERFNGISIYCRECHQARHQQKHHRVAVNTPITFKTTTHSNIHFLFKRHQDVLKFTAEIISYLEGCTQPQRPLEKRKPKKCSQSRWKRLFSNRGFVIIFKSFLTPTSTFFSNHSSPLKQH